MLQDPALLEEVDLAAGGLRWRVRRSASGTPARPVLLLLHGTGSSGRSWSGCAASLSKRFALLVPDLPGHGGSRSFADGVASLPRMAQALAALLRELGAAPVAAAGHSAGAALMLQMWLDGTLAAARGLVSINGALQPLPGLAGAVFPPLARAMATLPLVPWVAARAAGRPRALQHLVASTGSRLAAPQVEHYRDLLQQPRHVAGALQMMASWQVGPLVPALRRRLTQQPISLMLAAGSADTTVAPAQSQRVAQHLPGARFRMLADLGHLAHEEAPEVVGDLLAQMHI
jgi:magnesium chelatase accessory protein